MTPLNQSELKPQSAEPLDSKTPFGPMPSSLETETLLPESGRLFVKRVVGKNWEAEKLLQELESFAAYDIMSGEFITTRRRRGGVAAEPGTIQGTLNTAGYLVAWVDSKIHYMHRLVWLWMNGELPVDPVDHINGDRSDNRITNLRIVTASLSCRNRAMSRNNTTGYTGIVIKKDKFVSVVKINRKRIYMGTFPTAELAHQARLAYFQAHPELGFTGRHGL